MDDGLILPPFSADCPSKHSICVTDTVFGISSFNVLLPCVDVLIPSVLHWRPHRNRAKSGNPNSPNNVQCYNRTQTFPKHSFIHMLRKKKQLRLLSSCMVFHLTFGGRPQLVPVPDWHLLSWLPIRLYHMWRRGVYRLNIPCLYVMALFWAQNNAMTYKHAQYGDNPIEGARGGFSLHMTTCGSCHSLDHGPSMAAVTAWTAYSKICKI